MNELEKFKQEVSENIDHLGQDCELKEKSKDWVIHSSKHKYTYNFTWLGRPVIQFPQDIVALQEIIWQVKPDLIIETGIAHGGSLILSASILELLNLNGKVLGIDIDIRAHNRQEIEQHPLSHRIKMLEGSSIDSDIIDQVHQEAAKSQTTMVILDSNHTHQHVKEELSAYSPLVSVGSYLIVMDTIIERMPKDSYPDRPWDIGDNPKTAVDEFLRGNDRFKVDLEIDNKIQISMAPSGYLKCVKA